jgi:predicted RNase H-like nuclease (RuvC/YqgF family)
MNAMTIAQGIDMEAFHAQQEDALKKMTKGKLISYVGKLEAELTAYRHQVQTLTTENQNLTTNEELRETAIQGLKEEIQHIVAEKEEVIEGLLKSEIECLKKRAETQESLNDAKAEIEDLKNSVECPFCENGSSGIRHDGVECKDCAQTIKDLGQSHLEGFHKLLKVIHEADPITGMW